MTDGGRIRIGIGGWTFEPWRGRFYPAKLAQRRELEYAASRLTSIEINGTYYGSQKPDSFKAWRDQTPDDFVFAVKAPRFATVRRVLAESGESIERFFASGLMELGAKLGPINWQFMATKKFDPKDFAAFLALLPKTVDGRTIRHALEVRHASFACPEFIALAREHQAEVIFAFVYARLMGTREDEPKGYSDAELNQWAERAKAWAAGGAPDDLAPVAGPAPPSNGRDVFLYVISGFKPANPEAAMAFIERAR
jgi:uncharacterized protein YecE (DUF72 family)